MGEPAGGAPVVIAARRTPIAVRGGRLEQTGVDALAAVAVQAVVEDARTLWGGESPDPVLISDVVLGNCMGPGGNLGRIAALGAGLGEPVPGMMVDRQCASGLAAILTGAALASSPVRSQAGEASGAPGVGPVPLVVAGGAESASTAPPRLGPDGMPYARAPFAPSGFADPDMAVMAQRIATKRRISRHRQDAYAVRSHRLAWQAAQTGAFDVECVPVPVGDDVVTRDEGPRARMERLVGRARPLFSAETGDENAGESSHLQYAVTGANSSRNTDGAAAVVLTPAAHRGTAAGLELVGSVTVGVDPALPGLGPVPAVQRLLDSTGVALAEVAAIELVEAFACQALAVLDDLGLTGDHFSDGVDPRVNAEGGALALGHPWGGSAAVSVVRLFTRLVRAGAPEGTLGLATVAAGGGLGVAALFRVVR